MDELHALKDVRSRPPLGENGIWQPFVAGRALSVAVLVDADSNAYQPLLPCEQHLSQDGRFRYLGGVAPARDVPIEPLQRVAVAACKCVPGLRGYVGVDLVLPEASPDPVVVEINPRLTTSYLGYSALAEENLGSRLLHPDPNTPIRWRDTQIHFASHG
jgi:predicted ATP-grasp superfamily ATP-dependent carboligase